jgi:hypothetical protein
MFYLKMNSIKQRNMAGEEDTLATSSHKHN